MDDLSLTSIVVLFIIFMMSVVTHEVAHGYSAYLLGDDTAYLKGRLTFNPIKHIDPMMSILMPIVFYTSIGIPFGGAKPIPVNPMRFRNMRKGFMLTSLAGPASNILIAVMLTLILSLTYLSYGHAIAEKIPTAEILRIGILINVVLAFFNMMPIPPLDGSRVLAGLVDRQTAHKIYALEPYGMMMVLGVVFLLPRMGINIIGHVFDGALFSANYMTELAKYPLQMMQ